MDIHVDEAEHSMEMHLSYLAKVFHGYPVKVVPILVGALSAENEAMYGKLLAKYVDDLGISSPVSSDFCHWGSSYPVKVVPILVGALSAENEAMYGKLLAKYADDLGISSPCLQTSSIGGLDVKELLNKDKDQFPGI